MITCVFLLSNRRFVSSAVFVWMLGYRVNNRREDVQHENHGCNQTRPEKNGDGTGSPSAQKPRAERWPSGGVWRELSGCVAWQRQGRPEAALTCLARGSGVTALRRREETVRRRTPNRWMCNFYFWAFLTVMHAAKRIQVQWRTVM